MIPPRPKLPKRTRRDQQGEKDGNGEGREAAAATAPSPRKSQRLSRQRDQCGNGEESEGPGNEAELAIECEEDAGEDSDKTDILSDGSSDCMLAEYQSPNPTNDTNLSDGTVLRDGADLSDGADGCEPEAAVPVPPPRVESDGLQQMVELTRKAGTHLYAASNKRSNRQESSCSQKDAEKSQKVRTLTLKFRVL